MTRERAVVKKASAILSMPAVLFAVCLLAGRDAPADVLTRSWRDRAGACALVLEHYDGGYHQLRISAAAPGSLEACVPTFAELSAGLGRLLAEAAPDGVITLFLGSVADIPGLSAELVAASRSSAGWDEPLGRPRAGEPNGFVSDLLLRSAVLRELVPGYEILGVSVEKVLVPTRRAIRDRHVGDGVPDGRVPYDAQLWVRLRARQR